MFLRLVEGRYGSFARRQHQFLVDIFLRLAAGRYGV
jgi:hypothetical protein